MAAVTATTRELTALASGMIIDVNGRLLDSSKFTLTSTAADELVLTITEEGNYVSASDTIKVMYNAPESDAAIIDSHGNLTADFNQTIVNASTFEQTIAVIDTAGDITTTNAGGNEIARGSSGDSE